MEWGKKQSKEHLNYDDIVFVLLVAGTKIVKSASQTLMDGFPPDQQSKLPKVEYELFYFFMFALDYWWQTDIARTQEQKRCFGETLGSHLDIMFGDEPTEQALTALQERFIAYGQIVNEKYEKNDYAAIVFRFTTTLSDYCDIPFVYFSASVHTLFLTAMKSVHELSPFRE